MKSKQIDQGSRRMSGHGSLTGSSGEHPWRRNGLKLAAPILLLGAGIGTAHAIDKVIEPPVQFLSEAFGANPPPAQVLQLSDAAQSQLSAALGHAYSQQRLHYWRANGRSAWILDDIGKTGYQPTTAGFVVHDGQIVIARVLIYRESHGEEVSQPSFLQQFVGARATGEALDKHIDGISGATISVHLMQRMARAALALDALTK